MKVQCGQCPAKYAVADDRIRDKKVRIRCRRCNAAIVVDGKVDPPLVTSTPARHSGPPLSSMPAPESLPPPSSPDADSRLPSPRPVAHTIMGGLEAPVARHLVDEHVAQTRATPPSELSTGEDAGVSAEAAAAARPGMPARDRGLTDPPLGDVTRWRVALTKQDLRWMTTEEITQAFRVGAVKAETFVFRAGMPSWVTLLEVTAIADALSSAGLAEVVPRPASSQEGRSGDSPVSPRPSSLPPPRKPGRNAAVASGGALDVHGADDSDDDVPFALVSERSNANPERGEESSTAAAASLAGAGSDPRPSGMDEAAQVAPGRDDVQLRPAVVPVPAEALAGGAPVAPAAVGDPSWGAAPSIAVPQPPSERGSRAWLWVLLALLLAAAAFFLGPRFGLRWR